MFVNTNSHKHIDALIVGQGLAGSLIAWQLHQAGKSVVIIDNNHQSSASLMAAGLINPMAGKRLIVQTHSQKRLNYGQQLYQSIEKKLNTSFYYHRAMLRLFKYEKQLPFLQKAILANTQHWFSDYALETHPNHPDSVAWLLQKQCAWLDLKTLLHQIRSFFISQKKYIQTHIDSRHIRPCGSLAKWGKFTAKHVIFCEGARVQQNHWFNDLPLQPAKGEIIDFKNETLDQQAYIVNNGYWLLQKPNLVYRTGATHEWIYDDDKPTEKARSILSENIHQLNPSSSLTITAQQAAIRPASRDKQPWIGSHHHYPQLKIINGLGGRGAFFAPAVTHSLAQYICHRTAIPKNWNIRRFYAAR